MTEDQALIEFILAREPGSVLREIAERRLLDLRRMENRVFPQGERRLYANRFIKCINIANGMIYDSIKDASIDLGVPYDELYKDICRERGRMNVKRSEA